METEPVRIRRSRYAILYEYSKLTGIPIEELVDRALTVFLQEEEARVDKKARASN